MVNFKFILFFVVIVWMSIAQSFAKATPYPSLCNDTLVWMEVTYFDHFSGPGTGSYCDPSRPNGILINGETNDCSNYWEFNGRLGTLPFTEGCVEDKLGLNNTPVFKPYIENGVPKSVDCPNCCGSNQYMAEWFVENSSLPNRKLPKNKKYIDSVQFCRINKSSNIFEARSNSFFPLTDKEKLIHNTFPEPYFPSTRRTNENFGFTMKFERSFTYTSGDQDNQEFKFTGDDDVWVYLNKVLIVDIGGLHAPATKSITLKEAINKVNIMASLDSSIKPIKPFDLITLNFFIAERHVEGSNFQIITGFPIIIPTKPKLPPVAINPSDSEFAISQSITLSGQPAAQIFFRTDTTQTYLLYTGQNILINKTSTISAFQVKSGWINSDTTSKTYFFNPPPPKLPNVSITPTDSEFIISQKIILTGQTGAQIYFRTDTSPAYTPYTGQEILITQTSTVFAYQEQVGWISSDTTSKTYTLRILNLSAWIIDGNLDGKADSIFIRYPKGIDPQFTGTISPIYWPGNSLDAQTASWGGTNPITSLNDSTLVLDFSKKPFPYGVTGPGAINPTLTLSYGQVVPIQDRIPPILIRAEKLPSSGMYIEDNGVSKNVKDFPDTLMVTFSEPIQYTGSISNLDSLFQYIPNKGSTGKPITLDLSKSPTISPDSLVWKFVVNKDITLTSPRLSVEDSILLNLNSGLKDVSENTALSTKSILEGQDSKEKIPLNYLLEPIVGTNPEQQKGYKPELSTSENFYLPVLDTNGVFLNSYEDASVVIDKETWIPPYGFNTDGSINENLQNKCDSLSREKQSATRLKPGCLSIVQLLTTEPFKAEISIVDHLGISIYNSKQQFGYCGEFQNPNRISALGFYSAPLVWNQTTSKGKKVGSGVYIWKIKVKYKNGRIENLFKNQGVFRDNNNDARCTY